MRVVVIDNYDSFTWNLAQQLGALGAEPIVRRNDQVRVDEVVEMAPDRVVLSPGPGTPADTGITMALLDALAGTLPILGVCLGHQAIAAWLGARIVRARRLVHGKTSRIRHEGDGLFRGLPSPLTVARYHSLVVEPDTLPATPTAWTDDGELMAFELRERQLTAVQFHPESFLTEEGDRLMANFLAPAPARVLAR